MKKKNHNDVQKYYIKTLYYFHMYVSLIVDKMDRSGPNWSEWTDVDHNGPIGLNSIKWTEMIQIGPKWTEVDLMDRSKSKWTKLDQSGLELTIILIKRACNSCCAQQGEVIIKKKKKTNKQTNKQNKTKQKQTNKQRLEMILYK